MEEAFTSSLLSNSRKMKDIVIRENYDGVSLVPEGIDKKDFFGDTQLHQLLNKENAPLEDIQKLLKQGASITEINLLGETPLSLALKKENSESLLSLFEKHKKCYFIKHTDFVIPGLTVNNVLKNKAERFYAMVNQGLHKEGVASVMSTLHAIFNKAAENDDQCKEGIIITENGADCLINMKISDFERFFGKDIIDSVKDTIDAFTEANIFICRANSGYTYLDELSSLLKASSLVCANEAFHYYVMYKLLINVRTDCWNLLFCKGFNPDARPCNELSPIMYEAALRFNTGALVALVKYGADYDKPNRSGVTPIDCLLSCSSMNAAMRTCIVTVKSTLQQRASELQKKEGNHTQDIMRLNEAADKIERMLCVKR